MSVDALTLAQLYGQNPYLNNGFYYPQTVMNDSLQTIPFQNYGENYSIPTANISYPSFQGAAAAIETLPEDKVEVADKAKKKKRSLGARIAIGLGITLAAVATAYIAICKHQTNKLQRLYKEKLVPKIFDKEITFTEATTKEEALKYAKEILGVQKIDENMTLDALNYANRGITDVVNKNIGQEVFIPRSYFYDNLGDTVACVDSDIRGKCFGELAINKDYFDNEFLTKSLDEQFKLRDFAKKAKETTAETTESAAKNVENGLHHKFVSENELVDLLNRYKANPDNLSVAEKRTLLYSFGQTAKLNAIVKFDFIEFLEKNKDKIKLNAEELKKLPHGKQGDAIDKYLKEKGMSLNYYIYLPADDGISVIYHEMGHMQDFGKNLKELDLKFWNLSSRWKAAKAAAEEKHSGKTIENRSCVDELDNRWGGITYDGFADLLKNNPEEFKKLYPDLYKHLTDKDIKHTAWKVSRYATTSIGEFVAEVYKMMIKGEPIPEDVLALYKKYNGPLPKGF